MTFLVKKKGSAIFEQWKFSKNINKTNDMQDYISDNSYQDRIS